MQLGQSILEPSYNDATGSLAYLLTPIHAPLNLKSTPAGNAIAEIKQGRPFYGEVPILGTPYITGYEPMKDATGKVIGIYYVGYKK